MCELQELDKCDYAKGDDGRMLSTLLNPKIASAEILEDGWSVESVLNSIARADPAYHALIDTGKPPNNIPQLPNFILQHSGTHFH